MLEEKTKAATANIVPDAFIPLSFIAAPAAQVADE